MLKSTPLPAPHVAMVRASVLAPLRQEFAAAGQRLETILHRHGLFGADLTDPYAPLPLARYLALFEDAAHTLGDDSLGLRLGMRVRPADIGPAGVLFSLSASLQLAFERLARFVRSVQGGTISQLTSHGEDFLWHYVISNPALRLRRQDAEFTLATCCQLARSCFSANWRPLEVHFEHTAGGNSLLLHKFFRAPVYFNQPGNRMLIEGAPARRAYRGEDAGLTYILERHINDLISVNAEPQSLREHVSAIISQEMGQRAISLHNVATALGTTARTLQRRLKAEGTSLRDMLQEQRSALASQKLTQEAASMGDIAQALGYADRTAFWRAFRRWQGTAPSRQRGRRKMD